MPAREAGVHHRRGGTLGDVRGIEQPAFTRSDPHYAEVLARHDLNPASRLVVRMRIRRALLSNLVYTASLRGRGC